MNYHDMPIKEVMFGMPKVGELLAAYGVGCITCTVGTCLLRDVLDIHNFSEDKKKVIMSQVDKIIAGEDVEIEPIKLEKTQQQTIFCSAIQQLVDEHKNILRLLDLAWYIVTKRRINDALMETLKKVIYYVRNYVDKCHHVKEENILFKKVTDMDNIYAMITEHEMGYNLIRIATEGIESNNQTQIKQALLGYVDLIREHIKREEKIMYLWFEKILSNMQKTEIQKEFEAVDLSFGRNMRDELVKFLDENNC